MSVDLKKATSDEYVGRVGWTGTTHKLVANWSYSTGTHTVCGIEWIATHHFHSGKQINITCRKCLSAIRREAK